MIMMPYFGKGIEKSMKIRSRRDRFIFDMKQKREKKRGRERGREGKDERGKGRVGGGQETDYKFFQGDLIVFLLFPLNTLNFKTLK